MPRIRSIIIRAEVDTAKRAHNCKGDDRHRLHGGETRLNVRNGRGWDRYCLKCAITIVQRDKDKLDTLARNLEVGATTD